MRRTLLLGLAIALVVALMSPLLVSAADPTVNITVTAEVIAITNTQATWAIGTVAVNDTKYFSATNAQDDDYSQIENTGNVAVDVEIRGTDLVGSSYTWTLGTTAASETYSLYANKQATPTVYDVEVKKAAYVDIVTALAAAGTNTWSMKFTAPTAFNAGEAGDEKSATITLVASKAS